MKKKEYEVVVILTNPIHELNLQIIYNGATTNVYAQ